MQPSLPFALDSSATAYGKKMHRAGADILTEIEGEFERYLLEQDGLHPQRQRVLTAHIRPTRRTGGDRALSAMTAEQAEQAAASGISFNKLLPRAQALRKRNLIYGVRCGYAVNTGPCTGW